MNLRGNELTAPAVHPHLAWESYLPSRPLPAILSAFQSALLKPGVSPSRSNSSAIRKRAATPVTSQRQISCVVLSTSDWWWKRMQWFYLPRANSSSSAILARGRYLGFPGSVFRVSSFLGLGIPGSSWLYGWWKGRYVGGGDEMSKYWLQLESRAKVDHISV